LLAFFFGAYYNFANVLRTDALGSVAVLFPFGYLLLVLAPLFMRAYKTSIVLLGLGVAFIGWILL
jgi:hypothetical protein